MKFIDLFAGLGGFNIALSALGHECVFASEIDIELQELYKKNFPNTKIVVGDIRKHRDKVPKHEILCAGFPCQPFSKSGFQLGLSDENRGTLFEEITYILKKHHPQYIILENVGNFERHDNGRTWKIIKGSLIELGYEIQGTEHKTAGGTGLISPHHMGYPHSRERFFIVGKLGKFTFSPFPVHRQNSKTNLLNIIQKRDQLTINDKEETKLTIKQNDCIEHWNVLIKKVSLDEYLPSFPIWGDEINANYPYEQHTPYAASLEELSSVVSKNRTNENLNKDDLLLDLPRYARFPYKKFPAWKINFIGKNRTWFKEHASLMSSSWIDKLISFPPSLRKLEWNCKYGERNVWSHILQFRPSGLRVKCINSSPSLIAMTSTQIPIIGPEKRFLTRVEGLRLQNFPDTHLLPVTRDNSFKALGNAVHVGVVQKIAERLLNS